MEKIRLTLTGRQRGEDGEETVTETRTIADYCERNGSHYIIYEEEAESGGSLSKNTLKLKGKLLELTKRGAVTSRMVFEAGKNVMVDYATPFGCLKMELATRSLESSFQDGKTKIRVDYTLYAEGRVLSHCMLDIKFAKYFPIPAINDKASAFITSGKADSTGAVSKLSTPS